MEMMKKCEGRRSVDVYKLSVFAFAKTDAFRRFNSIRRLSYSEKKNALFVASRSDRYIVSMQQTVHSAISRGFEPCFEARYLHLKL